MQNFFYRNSVSFVVFCDCDYIDMFTQAGMTEIRAINYPRKNPLTSNQITSLSSIANNEVCKHVKILFFYDKWIISN